MLKIKQFRPATGITHGNQKGFGQGILPRLILTLGSFTFFFPPIRKRMETPVK